MRSDEIGVELGHAAGAVVGVALCGRRGRRDAGRLDGDASERCEGTVQGKAAAERRGAGAVADDLAWWRDRRRDRRAGAVWVVRTDAGREQGTAGELRDGVAHCGRAGRPRVLAELSSAAVGCRDEHQRYSEREAHAFTTRDLDSVAQGCRDGHLVVRVCCALSRPGSQISQSFRPDSAPGTLLASFASNHPSTAVLSSAVSTLFLTPLAATKSHSPASRRMATVKRESPHAQS